MTTTISNISKAKKVLNNDIDAGQIDIISLIEDLKAQAKFSYAAMLLHRLLQNDPGNNELLLNLSLCIYKDTDLPSAIKYDKALDYLNRVNTDGNDKEFCSKCAQYGAIYKRMWQAEGNLQYLDAALLNYKKGYERWRKGLQETALVGDKIEEIKHASNDNGYNAVNYAFCLELFATVKSNKKIFDFIDDQSIESLKKEAQKVRDFIIDYYLKITPEDFSEQKALDAIAKWHPLLKSNEWIYGTIGETFFGAKNYDAASYFYVIFKEKMIKKGIVQDTEFRNEWKISIAAQQLYNLSSIQNKQADVEASEYATPLTGNRLLNQHREVLKVLINKPNNIGDLTFSEKVGIGLSGGGFRAALYHIGVLARLAELDMLRHLEVISCVSGGSIIGAYYYLKVKNLLESKDDNDITCEDYIQIVKEIEIDFLEKVQKNLRQEVFTNLFANAKMAYDKYYSRTHRLGELYEEHFYAPLMKDKKTPVFINTLKIFPAEKDGQGNIAPVLDFSIKKDNWYRRNKIPNLVLNATSLNTGHNWQFTASWMGEPPASLQPEIDMKSRLRRMYYSDAPEAYRNFRLGYAVASSSCVPGLFAAFSMPDLYPNVDLKLVDGGVHDNQGISSLIEQECKFMIVSDASGQLPEQNTILNAGPLYTVNRTNGILQERIRENEFMEISTRYRSSQLSNLKFMHLRKNLYPAPISWYSCDEPLHFLNSGIDFEKNNITPYKIDANVQDLISKIRTDLDAFSEQEAFALMYSGYQMTKYEFRQGKEIMEAPAQEWRFFSVAKEMLHPEPKGKFMDVLNMASILFGKVLQISLVIKVFSYIIASAAIVIFIVRFYLKTSPSNFDTAVGAVIVAVLLVLFFSERVKKRFNILNLIEAVSLFVLGTFIIGPLINIYMLFFNKIYLSYGEVVKKWWKNKID
jgi:predicted acylesterase/phospholipase RssA